MESSIVETSKNDDHVQAPFMLLLVILASAVLIVTPLLSDRDA